LDWLSDDKRAPFPMEEVGVEVSMERLLCVTDHLLPRENQHWVSPAYLGRVVNGEARNREPDKIGEVRWFRTDEIPGNLAKTAKNAIRSYLGQPLLTTRR
jgi:ADP-ribose pyrophosphatase YjhB (NUDIX family)